MKAELAREALGAARERSQELQEELGLRSGSSAPPGGQRQKNSTYEAGGLCQAAGTAAVAAPGCRSQLPAQRPSLRAIPSNGTKEPGQFLHLKAARWGCCCSLRECWEADPWREVESRKIIVVVIHSCPSIQQCCRGTVALQILNGFITYQAAGSGLCLPPWFCDFFAPLQIPEDKFAASHLCIR